MIPRRLLTAASLLTLSVSTPHAVAAVEMPDAKQDLGLELEAGRVDVQTAQPEEIDKQGSSFAASLFLRRAVEPGALHLGIGVEASKVAGANVARGFKSQDFAVRTPFLDLAYLHPLWGL